MPDERLDLARAWLSYIDDDLALARHAVDEVPSGAAFHVQQAVEKAFKAAIILAGQDPERTHDLVRLARRAQTNLTWTKDDVWLAEVSSWATTTRYPSDVYGPPPQGDDVRSALTEAERLVAELRAKLA